MSIYLYDSRHASSAQDELQLLDITETVEATWCQRSWTGSADPAKKAEKQGKYSSQAYWLSDFVAAQVATRTLHWLHAEGVLPSQQQKYHS